MAVDALGPSLSAVSGGLRPGEARLDLTEEDPAEEDPAEEDAADEDPTEVDPGLPIELSKLLEAAVATFERVQTAAHLSTVLTDENANGEARVAQLQRLLELSSRLNSKLLSKLEERGGWSGVPKAKVKVLLLQAEVAGMASSVRQTVSSPTPLARQTLSSPTPLVRQTLSSPTSSVVVGSKENGASASAKRTLAQCGCTREAGGASPPAAASTTATSAAALPVPTAGAASPPPSHFPILHKRHS